MAALLYRFLLLPRKGILQPSSKVGSWRLPFRHALVKKIDIHMKISSDCQLLLS
uniref:Uncharacterized protein n=1 Tax=Oryza brachyantha TaxID=4533 RepID=J3MAJ4_ORYBR